MSIINGKTAAGLVAFVLARIGVPYNYGLYGKVLTMALLNAKTSQYPAHYGASRRVENERRVKAGLRACDCVGLIKWYLWLHEGLEPRYNVPAGTDRSANSTYSAAKVKGTISTMPEIPGLCVWYDGHIGVYCGNGKVIEARGFAYGVVETALTKTSNPRKWTHWLEHPEIDYSAGASTPPIQPPAPDDKYPLGFGARTLRQGVTGPDVTALQRVLIDLNYSVGKWGADGDFGASTHNAVVAYQTDKRLTADGIVGPKTREAMERDALTLDNPDDGEASKPARTVLISGGNVNVRLQPNTAGRIIGVARNGERHPWAGEVAVNGWPLIEFGGEKGYVSNLYGKLEG